MAPRAEAGYRAHLLEIEPQRTQRTKMRTQRTTERRTALFPFSALSCLFSVFSVVHQFFFRFLIRNVEPSPFPTPEVAHDR